jgi:uncharacterized protein (TIGR00730 family)
MNSICVFCGSSFGDNPAFAAAAADLGRMIAERGFKLVYGAGDVGLMGVLANAALAAGGQVTGVIPSKLVEKEVAHQGLTELVVVETMHERKDRMSELADAFIVLPGGFGTLDETFDVLTRGQLAYHQKPCGLLNVDGFFDGLLEFLDSLVEQEFLRQTNRDQLITETKIGKLIDALASYDYIHSDKWIGR